MPEPKLKIGIMGERFEPGTGPGSYFSALERSLAGRHFFCRPAGSSCPELDLIHVIDAKRISAHRLDSVRAPVIADFHDHYWTEFEPFFSPDLPLRWLRQKQLKLHHLEVIKRAAAVVVHSEAVADSLRGVIEGMSFDGPPPPVHLVPYGVSVEKPTTPLPADHGGPLVLMVGRDLFRKGFPVMVRALKILLPRIPELRLMVIGREYWHGRAAARLLARGLPVVFSGGLAREQVFGWLARASALALPSRQEAFGLALIESMQSGVPVVAAAVGGIPEAVEHERSGLLHRPGDAADLAEKLERVIVDSALRERLIEGGLKKAEGFSLERMAAGLDSVYRAVLETR